MTKLLFFAEKNDNYADDGIEEEQNSEEQSIDVEVPTNKEKPKDKDEADYYLEDDLDEEDLE